MSSRPDSRKQLFSTLSRPKFPSPANRSGAYIIEHRHSETLRLGTMGITLILTIGIKESANLNTVMVVIKLVTVMLFIGVAGLYLFQHRSVAMGSWRPFIPPNQGAFGQFGWSGIARGASLVFFA